MLIEARTGITSTNTLILSELADAVFAFFLDLPEQLGIEVTRAATRDPLARALLASLLLKLATAERAIGNGTEAVPRRRRP